MPSIINASSTGTGGIVQTADASGVLQLQSNGSVVVAINSATQVSIATANTGGALTTSTTSGNWGVLIYDGANNASMLQFRNNVGSAAGNISLSSAGATSLLISSVAGVNFPATQVASADANTLDDYEEGTYTPVITLGITSPTYSQQVGRYTKIGNFVYVSARCNISSGTVTGSVLNISLPFTVSNNSSSIFPAGSTYFNAAAGNATNARPIAIDNAPTMQFVIQNATGQTAFNGTDYGSGGAVNFTLVYQAA
jgi:hypothetical protein